MIKVIHAADLHLDSPFSMLDIQRSEIRRKELNDSFLALTELASSSNTDILLLAGDLFDSDFVTLETANMIFNSFKKLTNTRIVISPGNHDPYSANGIYKRLSSLKNVYIFKENNINCFDFPEINCTVFGYAFTSREYTERPLASVHPADASRINIFSAHADMSSIMSKTAPITISDIENSGFDYVALGHIHNTDGIKKAKSGTYFGYSGAFEGRGFDETGEKGVYLSLIDKDSGSLSFDCRFVPFSKRIYLKEKLDITGASNNAEVIAKAERFIKEKHLDSHHALELELTGMIAPTFKVFPNYIKEKINELFSLKIIDLSLPLYEFEKLEKDTSIKGVFAKALRPMLESENREEREIAALALKYGISAISGSDVSDIS